MQVYVRVKTGNGGEFLWGRNTFLDRYDLMMDVFQKYENGEKNWESESKVYIVGAVYTLSCILINKFSHKMKTTRRTAILYHVNSDFLDEHVHPHR